jgi:hypothetical protein
MFDFHETIISKLILEIDNKILIEISDRILIFSGRFNAAFLSSTPLWTLSTVLSILISINSPKMSNSRYFHHSIQKVTILFFFGDERGYPNYRPNTNVHFFSSNVLTII